MRFWDAAKGKALAAFPSRIEIESVDLDKDAGQVLVAGNRRLENNVQILDAKSGRVISAFSGDELEVSHALFSSDARRVVTTGTSPPFWARIWEAASGREMLKFAHSAGILAAALSADDSVLATGGYGREIKVWDTIYGREQLTISSGKANVTSLAFSPNGKKLASARSDRRVMIYAMEPINLVTLAAARLIRPLTPEECHRYMQREDCTSLPSSKIVIGNELVRTGQSAAAMSLFRQAFSVVHLNQSDTAPQLLMSELHLNEARELAEVGDFKGAAAMFRAAVSESQDASGALNLTSSSWIAAVQVADAKRLVAARKWLEAVTILRSAIALDPKNDSAYRELAEIYDETQDYSKAVEAMHCAVQIRPDSSNYEDFADYLRLAKNYPEAILNAKNAIALDPQSERAHEILALAFLDSEDPDGALQEFEAAIAIEPTVYAYSNEADIYRAKGNFVRALDCLEKAKGLDRKYVDAYSSAADIYFEELAKYEAAYRELSLARELAPDDPGVKSDYAELCLAAGRFQEALDIANELLEAPVASQSFSESSHVAMYYIKFAALMLSNRIEAARAARQDLLDYVRSLPRYEQHWSYVGTRRFLMTYPMNQPERASLIQILDLIDKRREVDATIADHK